MFSARSIGDHGAMDDDRPARIDYTRTVERPTWDELPYVVRETVERAAGSRVSWAQQPARSGFSGGFAAVVHLADDRRAFAKAGSSRNPFLCSAYAREAVVLEALPTD